MWPDHRGIIGGSTASTIAMGHAHLKTVFRALCSEYSCLDRKESSVEGCRC